MLKGFDLDQMKNALRLTKKHKIETLISFIVGFNNEDEKEIENTKKFILLLDPDYISINVLVPRVGSIIREESGFKKNQNLDNSMALGKAYPSGKYAFDYKLDIEKNFFFRTKKLFRYMLLSLKTRFRFVNLIKNGFSILSRIKKGFIKRDM